MGIIVDILQYFVNDHPFYLVLVILVYICIFIVSIQVTKQVPGKNPFKYDTRKIAKDLVTDQNIRDAVIKQGFHVRRIPEHLDAVIVGSGIGALTAGVILAKSGKKVLLLEQHDQAGGCCHTYIEKGFEFDVGIHYVGEMRNNTMARLLIEQITDGQLVWEDLIDEFDVVALGEPGKQQMYPFHAGGPEPWKKAMLENFPNEEVALDKFLAMIKDVRRNVLGAIAVKSLSQRLIRFMVTTGIMRRFTKYFYYSQKTLKEVLDSITDNKDLKAVLSYSFGDYGTTPKEGSFAMHAMLINHYLYGASYPRGGASEIAFHMIPIIERAGGRVLVRAPVKQILTENGKVAGVRVERSSGDLDIFAPIVISDAGFINTYTALLPKDVAQKSNLSKLIVKKKVRCGMGAMSIFVGLSGTAEELQLKPQNIWSFTSNDIDKITRDYLKKSASEALDSDIPLLFISFPSTKDSSYNHPARFPGKSCCTIVTLARWDWFENWEAERVKKRGDDYETFKNAIGEKVWQQTLALFPQLADKVEYFEVGSPVTNRYYLGSAKGEIYGLDHDVKRFSPEVTSILRPETDIPGLFLTGQDVFNCGFLGACFGGVLCASRLLNRNCYEDLVELRKSIAKRK